MGSSSKRRQTFSKMTRERAVKERRQLKQEKKEEKKRAAAAALEAEAAGTPVAVDDETEAVEPSEERTPD
jgi:hypothetical protein